MTAEEFYSNPALSEAIRADLAQPHWRAAISVLESLRPSRVYADANPAYITGNGDALAAGAFAYERCLRNLTDLAFPPKPRPKPMESTYGATEPTE